MAQATFTDTALASGTVVDRPVAGRRVRLVFAIMAIVVVAAWFLPAIAARSGLRHRFIHAILPAYPGGTQVGDATLGWLSPVTLRRVVLTDDDGNQLASISEMTTSRSLASLLFAAGDDLGLVTIREPRLNVRLRPDGSNLEDMVRPLFDAEGSGAGLTVIVEDGAISWTNLRGEPCPGGFEKVDGKVRQTPGETLPAQIELRAALSDGERQSPISVRWRSGVQDATESSGMAVFKATTVPLAPLRPWFNRFHAGISAEGLLTADLLATATDDHAWTLDGWIEGKAIRIAGDESAHPLLLESVTLKGKGDFDRDRVRVERAILQSDLGTVDLAGRWTFASLIDAHGWLNSLEMLIEQDTHLTASIDLAQLLEQLPSKWRTGQTVESGRLSLTVRSTGEVGKRAGAIELTVSEIIAGNARQFVWESPLHAEALVQCTAAGITVERLEATSEFLTVTGSGSVTSAELNFDANLDALRQRLHSLVQIPQDSLAGRIDGRVHVQQHGNDRSRVEVWATARGLSLAVGGSRCHEQELTVTIEGDLCRVGTLIRDVQSGQIAIRSAEGDEFVAVLSQPVSLTGTPVWKADVRAKGDISRWLARARMGSTLVPAGDWDLSGKIVASAKVSSEGHHLVASDVVVDSTAIQLRLAGRSIDEPRVRLTGSAAWEKSRRRWTVPSARLLSETATVDVKDLIWPSEGREPAAGQVAFRAGIGRVARYIVSNRPMVWLSGVAAGTIDLRVESSETVLNGTVELERPTLTRPGLDSNGKTVWLPVWSDDRASFQMAGRYTNTTDTLAISHCRFTSSGLSLEAAGQIERATSNAIADVAGTVTCDLESLSERFKPGLPDDVVVRGHSTKPFTLRGPLYSSTGLDPQLSARAGFGWEAAKLWGLAVGTGEVSVGLKNRTLAIEPFDWPVGSGRVRGSAAIALSELFVMTVPQGRVADRVVLTPDVCRTWLRYAAPALADSTTVEGTASIDIAACTVPLVRPEGTEARGVLEVHSATAVPGAVAKSLVDVVRQIQSIAGRTPSDGSELRLVAPQQKVTVAVRGGRVHHDRFTVHVGDSSGPAITTAGSVGFDQSIDLVAEVAVDRTWFKNERIAADFGGQALRVPIRGTLSNPVPDSRALQEFGRKAATGAIEGLLEREVDKQFSDPFRKLFD